MLHFAPLAIMSVSIICYMYACTFRVVYLIRRTFVKTVHVIKISTVCFVSKFILCVGRLCGNILVSFHIKFEML